MRTLLRSRLALGVGLSLAMLAGTGRGWAADEKEKVESSRVTMPTFDNMELSGTFYPSVPAAGKKDKEATVLLLHDFTHRGGGGSHKDGWDNLAARLQKEGYAVLQFDFRGFGGSTSVGIKFWSFRSNHILKEFHGGAKQPAAAINQKNFPNIYYNMLINDIASARAYLDVRNDNGDVNTSNLFVIGAGDGAALGAMWMAAECRRQKDKDSDRLPVGLGQLSNPRFLNLDEPESKDFAGAIWLSISPSLAGRSVSQAVRSALVDVARESKIPTAFVFGDGDQNAFNLAKNYMNALQFANGKKVDLKNTGTMTIARTSLSGGKLLDDKLRSIDSIIKQLNKVMEDRGIKNPPPAR